MITERIIRFLKGYLYVRADSRFIERFINICMHRGISVQDIKRYGSNRITFKTDIKSFFNIRVPAKRTKTSVKIIKRCGLPFIIKKYKKRRLVLACGVVILALLWYMSNHVMGITVFGNSRIPVDEIKNALSECGLTIGMKTKDVASDTLRNKMMSRFPDLAWVGVNANGSRVYIEIVERIEKEEGVDKNAPACNLVAKCDGEIEKIEIREGQAVVQIGSGVRKGDVLVSGIVDNPIDGFSYVHSRGDIIAKTRYVKTKAYPLSFVERNETGKDKSRYVLYVNNKEIPLYKNIPYISYNMDEFIMTFPRFFNLLPDISLKKVKFKEVYENNKTISPTEALGQAEDELLNELKDEIDDKAEIVESNITYTLSERNEAIVTLELICRENIVKENIIEVPVRE